MRTTSAYANPPIIEALLDIRIEASAGLSLTDLQGCLERVRDRYPKRRELKSTSVRLNPPEELATEIHVEQQGYLGISEDEKQFFQARLNGFTANRLAPYSSWEEFRQETRRLWDVYREVVKPTRITRIALRYINRIDIPAQAAELKQYFKTFPEVAADLPQVLESFFMQLILPLPDAKARVIVVETLAPPPPNSPQDVVSVVLDLDLFRTEDLPHAEEDLWSVFEILREQKNKVFRACLTEQAEELFHVCRP